MKRNLISSTSKRRFLIFLGVFSATVLGGQPQAAHAGQPLANAHAHNDYEHDRPLLDALAQGFTSVEADVHLIGKELLVAHNARDIQADETLQSLYLEPLRDIVSQNGGNVFSGGSGFTLFIDIKTDGEATYQAIKNALKYYKEILTSFTHEKTLNGAITVIISGNRPRQTMEDQSIRYAAYDGRLGDLDTETNPNFIPIISDNWKKNFNWKGNGDMPPNERAKLVEIVSKSHANDQRVRLWATPDIPSVERNAVWLELLHAGVDLINTDDLVGLRNFLIENGP